MAILKLPTGTTATIGIAGKSPVGFTGYGQSASFEAQAFAVENKRMAVLFDSTGPDAVEVLTQPSVGRVIARSDGGLSYDLNEADPGYFGTQEFTYRRNNNGIWTGVTASVDVAPTERPAGWGNGDYYYIETDADDAVMVQPSETARVVHVAVDGLSEADILARHSGTGDQLDRANVRARDLQQVPARDADGSPVAPTAYYGQTEALALNEAEAAKLFNNSVDDVFFRSWWVLYKRGQYFSAPANLAATLGESQLHPSYVGSYGTGPKPVFDKLFDKSTGMAACLVFQNLDFTQTTQHRNVDFLMYDGCCVDGSTFPSTASAVYPFGGGGVNQDSIMNRANTIRRAVITDAVPTSPTNDAEYWSRTNGDRISGLYQDDTYAPLFEKVYVDQIAWNYGYRSDQIGTSPKSPDDGSHGFYTQGDLYDVTARDIIVTNPSFNALQFRSGTVAQRMFMAFANAGLLFGNGEGIGDPLVAGDAQLTNPPVVNGREKKSTNLSFGTDIIVTEAGEKDGWKTSASDPTEGFQAILAGGIENQNHATTIKRATVINGGERGTPVSSATEAGPVGRVSSSSETYAIKLAKVDVDASWYVDPDVFIYNWSPSYHTGSDTTGLNTTALDALSTGAFNDLWKGTTGSQLADFVASLRADPAPWEMLPALLEYYQSETGQWVAPRTEAMTVTFEPAADGSTPGFRSDVTDDWSTGDLPGSFPGDSIDLNGYRVFWNISPKEQINDLTIGEGGSLWLRGGDLNITGTVHTSPDRDTIRVRGGARLSAHAVSGTGLSVLVSDGRYRNTGTVNGGISVKAVCDSEAILCEPGGGFTLSAEEILTIGGFAKAGGDGQGGGTGTITLAPGSKTRFQVGARLSCGLSNGTKFAVPQARITGDTSGATAIVENHFRTDTTGSHVYKVYDLTGTFSPSETLTASLSLGNGFQLTANTDNGAGQIVGTPQVALGQMRKFRSGIHGLAPTDMALDITLGGALEIDLAGHEGAITNHVLIEGDSLSGAFDTVGVLNLGARDAVVSFGPTLVVLTVTAGGTGQLEIA